MSHDKIVRVERSEKVLSIKGMIEHLDMYMYDCSKCSCGEESHSCFKEEIMVVGRVRLIYLLCTSMATLCMVLKYHTQVM